MLLVEKNVKKIKISKAPDYDGALESQKELKFIWLKTPKLFSLCLGCGYGFGYGF